MLFNSIVFFIFFSVVTILYSITPKKYQYVLLLVASFFFYMYVNPYLILLVFITVLNDFTAGLLIKKYNHNRKIFLIESIALNFSILFFFKYFNFFTQNLTAFGKLIGWNYSLPYLNILLPIGLSFYIFKSISYVIEVYRGNSAPEKNIGIYSLYILFFPEILAGPIDRPAALIHQFREPHQFEYGGVTNGLKLIAWGLFKKLVIADRLAVSVNYIFNHLHDYTGLPLAVVVFFFAIQIYCDFSGYSDIAIGAGQVLGFKLMKNFDKPYFSRSISEFWRRWHISLSTWFRDYVFLPIAYKTQRFIRKPYSFGVKTEIWSYSTATFITMLSIGLWHGASWNFIVWGLLIGFYLIFSVLTKKIKNRVLNKFFFKKNSSLFGFFQILTTFILMCVTWIFFRAQNLHDAFYVIQHIFIGFKIQPGGYNLGLGQFQVLLSFVFILILIIVEIYTFKDENEILFVSRKPAWIRWPLYYSLICIIICFGEFGENNFLYFKF